MRVYDFDTVKRLLREDVIGCPSEALLSAHKESIEMNLARMATAMKPGIDLDQQLVAIERVVDVILEAGVFEADDDSAMANLLLVIRVCMPDAKHVSVQSTEAALVYMQALHGP